MMQGLWSPASLTVMQHLAAMGALCVDHQPWEEQNLCREVGKDKPLERVHLKSKFLLMKV